MESPQLLQAPTPFMKKQSTIVAIGICIGLIIGFGSLWLWQQRTKPTGTVATSTPHSENTIGTSTGNTTKTTEPIARAGEEDSVQVKDQPAGVEVFLSLVSLKAPGWVAVRESVNGAFGNILGASRFDAGAHQGTVGLLRPMEAGKTYAATLYRDNGDRLFDFKTDPLVVDESGNPVTIQFSAY